MRRLPQATLAITLGIVVSCGGGGQRDASGPPARTPTPLDPATTGVIEGEVRFEGTPPERREVRFGSFAECLAQHEGPVFADDVLVANGRVQNAFVYVADGLGERVFAIPAEPVTIDQHGCLFRPRVAGAQVGQTIAFVNSDPALHNVHGTPRASGGWNFALARRGLVREIRVGAPEVMVGVRCDLHPWMQSWLGVLDHPYFAVTGADGTFALRNVPPGTYTITAWHERFGTRSARVTLGERARAEVAFAYDEPLD